MSLDGKVRWKTDQGPAFVRGGAILADGLFLATDGNKVLQPDDNWAPLALADGKLLVRGRRQSDIELIGSGSRSNLPHREVPMPTAEEMFAHIHRDGLRELELERAQAHQVTEGDAPLPIVKTLREEYRKMLDAVIVKLKADKPDPETTFRNGLAALELVQQFRFVVDNLFESVKRDDSLQNSMTRYVNLGLLDFPTTSFQEEKRQSPWGSNFGSGRYLRKMMSGLRKVALTVIEIVMNAVKLIPKLVEIKPDLVIGWSGPFPSISLSFDLQADSISIHDLFNELKGAHTY